MPISSFSFVGFKVSAQKELGAAVSIQTPNASSLGKFGDIPVSLFTGTVDISIPITDVTTGSFSVPISLVYDASGCRPDDHPGLVGLNWSLVAGGVIKRQTNGFFDEYTHISTSSPYYAYYDRCTELGVSNWYSTEYLNAHVSDIDQFPDEFTFNVNGISGVFMLNHERKWVVRSKDNLSLKLTHEIQENVSGVLMGSLTLPRIISKFTLTTNDGTQYVFGGDINGVEFSQSVSATMEAVYNTHGGLPIIGNSDWPHHVQASAWHLTEIILPTGVHIKFHYSRFKNIQQAVYSEVSATVVAGIPITNLPYFTRDVNQTNKFLIYGSNLDSIKANDITCSFVRSLSNELRPPYNVKPISQDLCPADFQNLNYYKLDTISMSVRNKPVVKYAFSYIEKPSERLKLKEIKKVSAGNNIQYSYKVEYTAKLLPGYYSGLLDHWGYYNGKNFFGGASSQGNVTVSPDIAAYYQSREPDAALMDAEIIKKIIYPTGGYTEFFFEPHTYSSVVKQSPSLLIQTNSSNKLAGGLRIRKISTYDAMSSTTQVKEYFYTKDYLGGNTLSSGVLAGEPVYYESPGDGTYFKFSSLPLNYMNTTNGNHIAYSQVTERTGNGFTSFIYSNQDNGFLDKEPITQTGNFIESSKYYKKLYSRLDIERGLILKKKVYTTDSMLKRETINEYNQDVKRYNSYVRAVSRVQNSALNTTMIAFPLYTFYPYLRKETIIDYTPNGQVITGNEYDYDSTTFQLRAVRSFDAIGNQKMVQYKYPGDYTISTSAPATDKIYDIKALVDNNVIRFPIERTSSIIKSGRAFVIGSRLTHFKDLKQERVYDFETNIPISAGEFAGTYSTTAGFLFDNRYKEKIYYSKYDDRGNILEVISETNGLSSYLWGYNRNYPIAKVMNAGYNDIVALLGTNRLSQLALSYDDEDIKSAIQQLRAGLPNSHVYSYCYSPLTGMTSETAPNNITTYYEYDQFGRLAVIRDDKKQIVKNIGYQYMGIKRISLSDQNLDWGQVSAGQSITKNIVITNTGTLAVTVTNVLLPQGYSINNVFPFSLAPGESIRMDISYTSSAKGTFTDVIQFSSDAVGSNNIDSKVTVIGTKIIELSGNLDCGTVSIGPTSSCNYRTLTIKNIGTEPLFIQNILTPHPFGTNWLSGTITPGQTQSIVISFCPPVPGSFSGEIKVQSDKTGGVDTITAIGSAN